MTQEELSLALIRGYRPKVSVRHTSTRKRITLKYLAESRYWKSKVPLVDSYGILTYKFTTDELYKPPFSNLKVLT